MLGKLTKFEFKATTRIFLPLYIAVFVITLLNKCFFYLQNNYVWEEFNEGILGRIITIMSGFIMIAFVILIVATVFLTLFIILQRFYKNLFTDEGYLMHTLPVSAKAHIGAKLITASVWTAASFAVIVLAIFLLVVDEEVWNGMVRFGNIPMYAESFETALNVNFYGFMTFIIILAIITVPTQFLSYYLSIALGGLILPKHKIGGAFVGYVAISTVNQIVASIATAGGAVLLSENLEEMMNSPIPPGDFFYYIFGFSAFFSLAGAVIYFFITSHILTKKLNLE